MPAGYEKHFSFFWFAVELVDPIGSRNFETVVSCFEGELVLMSRKYFLVDKARSVSPFPLTEEEVLMRQS